jgi:8-oxo-dGTP diphosphatase
MESKKPGIGIGIFAINSKKDKFLLGQSVKKQKFGLPGGRLEFGETLEECAARELFEETNIQVVDLTRMKRVCFFNAINKEIDYHWLEFCYYVELDESEESSLKNNEGDKCYSWEWVDFDYVYSIKDRLLYSLSQFLELTHIKKISELVDYKQTF